MNDTTTITAEERARLRSVLPEHGNHQVEDRIILRLLNTVEQAEANVERLTKMVDWLASHTADICASVYQDSYDLHWWTDCEWKEAALRAVAAGEETYQK